MKKFIASVLTLVVILFNYPLSHTAIAATDIINDATLGANVISCWEMDEASGTRYDAVTANANDLTDYNTVGVMTGVQADAADFERSNSEVLYAADDATLDVTGDWSFAFWIKMEQLPGTAAGAFVHLEKLLSGNGVGVLTFGHSTLANDLRVQFSNGGSSSIKDYDVFWVAGDVGVWRHVVVTVDVSAGANGITVYKDGVSKSGTNSSNAATAVGANTNPMYVGASNTTVNFTDGGMDVVAFFGTALTSTDVGNLYASGAGIPCEAASGGGSPQPDNGFLIFE